MTHFKCGECNPCAATLEAIVRRVVREELRAILQPRRALLAADREYGEALLPLVREAQRDRVWQVAELAAVALRPDNVRLAAVLAPFAANSRWKALGKLLARLDGHPLAGLELLRVGDASSAVWQVVESAESETGEARAYRSPAVSARIESTSTRRGRR